MFSLFLSVSSNVSSSSLVGALLLIAFVTSNNEFSLSVLILLLDSYVFRSPFTAITIKNSDYFTKITNKKDKEARFSHVAE